MFISRCLQKIMADDMEVPPLEDMSSMLEKVLSRRDVKTDNGSSSRMPVVVSSGINVGDSSTNNGKDSSSVCVIH